MNDDTGSTVTVSVRTLNDLTSFCMHVHEISGVIIQCMCFRCACAFRTEVRAWLDLELGGGSEQPCLKASLLTEDYIFLSTLHMCALYATCG